jgi:hypothetical protein
LPAIRRMVGSFLVWKYFRSRLVVTDKLLVLGSGAKFLVVNGIVARVSI